MAIVVFKILKYPLSDVSDFSFNTEVPDLSYNLVLVTGSSTRSSIEASSRVPFWNHDL